MANPRAWSFLTVEGSRQYGGNTGYVDEPAALYRYDSSVGNHLQVAIGDLVLVRSANKVLGIARIAQILESTGTKERLRCPTCKNSNIKERARASPRWRCRNDHTFDEPSRETVTVSKFEARYGSTFHALRDAITLKELQRAVLRPSDQMSIKELDPTLIEKHLAAIAETSLLFEHHAASITDSGSTTIPDEGNDGSRIEARKRVLRVIEARRGQAAFRRRLVRRYGLACQISGCKFPRLIEAAHVDPYSSSENNGGDNGLLLRTDLHTLFDLGFLGINPHSLKVSVHPDLADAGYGDFNDTELRLKDGRRPRSAALARRWNFFLMQSGSSVGVGVP